MRFERDKGFEKVVLDNLRENAKRVSLRGVKSLLQCPRKIYWLVKEEVPPTDEQLLDMARGSSHHSILEILPLTEVRVELDGIVGKIDFLHDMPVEIFSTALGLGKTPRHYPFKLRQLGAYIHMLRKNGKYDGLKGRLLVFHYNARALRSWVVEYAEQELEKIWGTILWHKELIEKALETGVEPIPDPDEGECARCMFRGRCHSPRVL